MKAAKSSPDLKVPQFNLNSILTIVGGIVMGFIWNSVVKQNDYMARMQATQEITQKSLADQQKTLAELMPKPEIMLRFSVVEKDLLELRARTTALEIEVNKIRK